MEKSSKSPENKIQTEPYPTVNLRDCASGSNGADRDTDRSKRGRQVDDLKERDRSASSAWWRCLSRRKKDEHNVRVGDGKKDGGDDDAESSPRADDMSGCR